MSGQESESESEGFSASEDEWKPNKDGHDKGGESSDDDDSDFEASPVPAGGAGGGRFAANKRKDQKGSSGIKGAGASVKKRKPGGQSLRSKLYNKYRPPPKTFPTSPTSSQNSPSASGSNRGKASKNARTPNESEQRDNDSSSDSSVEDYLVNPDDLDLASSFFTGPPAAAAKEKSPVPQFDCNAGITNLSDSGSEDNNESSLEDNATKAFDFRGLLENANSLERAKVALTRRPVAPSPSQAKGGAMDVKALLALGENQNYATNGRHTETGKANADEDDDDDDSSRRPRPPPLEGPSRLTKTKSTRIKRHTKTRPASTVVVAAGDTDDSDFEEVAEIELVSDGDGDEATPNVSGDLEIHVALPSRHLTKEQKTQHELELALKRRMNRDIKERQLLLHKASLMVLIARSYRYNRLLSDTRLMQASLKLLPSRNSYPTDKGTSVKYLESFTVWFKTAIKLMSPNLYPEKTANSTKGIVEELLAQIQRKEARSKQDMIFIFIVLARGMGMHCRLIANLQPMALKPAASDLIPIKLKQEDGAKNKSQTTEISDEDEEKEKKSKQKSGAVKGSSSKVQKDPQPQKPSISKKEAEEKPSPSRSKKVVEEKPSSSRSKKEAEEKPSSSQSKKESENSRSSRSKKEIEDKPSNSRHAREKISKGSSVEEENSRPSRSKKEIEDKPSSSRHAREKLSKGSSVEEEKSAKESPERGKKESPASGQGSSDNKPKLSRLKRTAPHAEEVTKKPKPTSIEAGTPPFTPVARRTRKASATAEVPILQIGSPVIPRLVLSSAPSSDIENTNNLPKPIRDTRSRSKSPKVHFSTKFLQGYKPEPAPAKSERSPAGRRKSQDCNTKARISPTFLKAKEETPPKRQLRTRSQKAIPQLDGGDDSVPVRKRPQLKKLQKMRSKSESDEDFQPSPAKQIKKSPALPKAVKTLRQDRRVLSTDDDESGGAKDKRKATAADLWVEVWSEAEEEWICIDLFKGKVHSVDSIRKSASNNLAYVFAFQDDLSLKDVTARYCPNWTNTVRKGRVEKAWLEETIAPYLGRRTKRDIKENQQLRRIHEDKPMPTSISDFKDHPLYALERHLLKFQGLYPPDAPTLGFIRGEAIYSRDCVHLLHSREIWLKSARVVKLGEQPYKIVKARPKWDRLTRTVIKDQPLEIFGYWQTQDYEPPTAENGIVPRNAYGNVELFKECMLPKKTVHLRLPGLARICKKLNIDCANAVIGFDFHQGACHPMYDGFVVCEEFEETVTDAWHEDQQEQSRKEQEKYEARVYGNWKKLIKGLLIRERLKKKYNF